MTQTVQDSQPASADPPNKTNEPVQSTQGPAGSADWSLDQWADYAADRGHGHGVKDRKALETYILDDFLIPQILIPGKATFSEIKTALDTAVGKFTDLTDTTATPAAPAKPLSVQESRLLNKAMVAKKKGENKGKTDLVLREYIKDQIDELYEWRTVTAEGRTSVLDAAMAASTPDADSSDGTARKGPLAKARSMPYFSTRVLVVKFLCWGAGIFGLSFFFTLLVFLNSSWGWQVLLAGRKVTVVLVLLFAAVGVAARAIYRRFHEPDYDLKRLRIWFVGLAIVAGLIAGVPSGTTAGAQESVDHVSNATISNFLNSECVAADTLGTGFNKSNNIEVCANSLSGKGRLSTLDGSEKLGYRIEAITAYLAKCQANQPDESSPAARIAFGDCGMTGINLYLGKTVADQVAKVEP